MLTCTSCTLLGAATLVAGASALVDVISLILIPVFWMLGAAVLAGAIFSAFMIGRRAGRSELAALQMEAGDENRRLQELLHAAERARANAESALGGSEGRAEAMAKMFALRGDFFANISHEFRTPLTLVIDPLETALKGENGTLDAALEQRLGTALRNARQMLRLINQLLDLTKVDAGSMHLRVSEQSVVPIIERVVERFGSDADRRRVSLIFSADADTPPLYVDAEKLERIVANLISNALLATPPAGKVLVKLGRAMASEDDSQVIEISVRDTGIGIPAEKQALIFDRFYQVGRPAREPRMGTGLGLAISREFVELHHGTISVESVPGFGSTFTVRLLTGHGHFSHAEIAGPGETSNHTGSSADAIEQPLEVPISTAPLQDRTDDDKSRPMILIVDDNRDVREMIRGHLTANYRIAEAANGFEGLSKARKMRPDLIISDVVMPGMEGIAFFRMVKLDASLKHIPLILLTALASDETRLEGIQAGVDAYITRPFRSEELIASIDNLISSRKALRELYSQEVVLKPHGVVVPATERAFIEQVHAAIDLHLEDSRFTVGQLAREVGLSETQLKRKLRALIDEAPVELIRKLRIERAAELLRLRSGNVGDVAFATGFSNLSYFAKCFRERWGVTPSQYLADAKSHAAQATA